MRRPRRCRRRSSPARDRCSCWRRGAPRSRGRLQRAAAGFHFYGGRHLRGLWLSAADLGKEGLGCRVGLRRQLALQEAGQVLVALDGLGLAPGRRQCPHDQAVSVLAHVVECYRPLGGGERLLATARCQLLLAEADQRAERQAFEPLPPRWPASPPRPLADGDVRQKPVAVEVCGRAQCPRGCRRGPGPRTARRRRRSSRHRARPALHRP